MEKEAAVVSELLEEASRGDQGAKNKLFEHVYDELRSKAHQKMAAERLGHTWSSTALVHEVFLHLDKDAHVFTKNRAYFFGAAARAMDQLLRDYWRRRNCRPEGHMDPEARLFLDQMAQAVRNTHHLELGELLEALEELKATDQNGTRRYEVARLRLWGGLTYQQCAQELCIATATAQRDWWAARAWLRRRLKGLANHDLS